jgi:hypothetical protein
MPKKGAKTAAEVSLEKLEKRILTNANLIQKHIRQLKAEKDPIAIRKLQKSLEEARGSQKKLAMEKLAATEKLAAEKKMVAARIREEREIAIQEAERSKKAREDLISTQRARHESTAATRIQAQVRGRQARRSTQIARHESTAATKIQAQIRGRQARAKVHGAQEEAAQAMTGDFSEVLHQEAKKLYNKEPLTDIDLKIFARACARTMLQERAKTLPPEERRLTGKEINETGDALYKSKEFIAAIETQLQETKEKAEKADTADTPEIGNLKKAAVTAGILAIAVIGGVCATALLAVTAGLAAPTVGAVVGQAVLAGKVFVPLFKTISVLTGVVAGVVANKTLQKKKAKYFEQKEQKEKEVIEQIIGKFAVGVEEIVRTEGRKVHQRQLLEQRGAGKAPAQERQSQWAAKVDRSNPPNQPPETSPKM